MVESIDARSLPYLKYASLKSLGVEFKYTHEWMKRKMCNKILKSWFLLGICCESYQWVISWLHALVNESPTKLRER